MKAARSILCFQFSKNKNVPLGDFICKFSVPFSKSTQNKHKSTFRQQHKLKLIEYSCEK